MQEERNRLLEQAARQGYADYRGVRISAQGKRFRIDDCILWNVLDNAGHRIGQAAMFNCWEFL